MTGTIFYYKLFNFIKFRFFFFSISCYRRIVIRPQSSSCQFPWGSSPELTLHVCSTLWLDLPTINYHCTCPIFAEKFAVILQTYLLPLIWQIYCRSSNYEKDTFFYDLKKKKNDNIHSVYVCHYINIIFL